jgi:predicted ATPase/DNA-binding CsgD family transcriptional regulator/Tfp pilus assembly protein PilF
MTSNIAVALSSHELTEPAGNLPAEPNAFVGRERDLSELVSMLSRVRALTLCGPGGIGKTRLALKLAEVLAPGFTDGAWIADLAEADSPERLVQLVAAALQIRQEPDRALAETLTEALRPRTMLLVLDTCEALVQESAQLVQDLLGGCPRLRVIATSREALRVRGEVIWRVPPLGLPAVPFGPAGNSGDLTGDIAGCEAVRLFIVRASAARPGFSLDPANAGTVAEICRTLDGVPLAIELAAARVRTLSAEQIRTRLVSKFQLLAHGDRTAPPRQQTLRATVEWSFDLLNEPERRLLSRLSVFHGWSLDMAEQVCAEGLIPASGVLDVLTALIDKSLVILEADADGEPRYRLLDAVRDLAAELAAADAELPALRAAHRDSLLALAEGIAAVAFLRGDPPWHDRVVMYHRVLAERANFRVALGYCAQHGEAEQGLRLCVALTGYWLGSGDVADGADWVDQMLALAGPAETGPAEAGLRARALALRAELAFEQEDYPGAARFAAECLELSLACGAGNPASALRMRAFTMLMTGQAGEALRYADEAVASARQMRDAWEEGVALSARAAVLAAQGQAEPARREFTEALDLLEGNNRWGVANVLYGLGKLARARGDIADAFRYFGEALAIYGEIDARPEMARCLGAIGVAALSQPDLRLARASLVRSVRLSLATGQRLGVARGLAALAALALAEGDARRAVRTASAARELFGVIGDAQAASATGRLDRVLEIAAGQLGQREAAALAAEGRALSPHQAVVLAAGERNGVPQGDSPVVSHANGTSVRAASPDGGPPANQEIAWPGSLTRREREVARLVARGLSNRDIGLELFISSATAARHVANIFGKLGFSSRSQVIAWVVRSGQA